MPGSGRAAQVLTGITVSAALHAAGGFPPMDTPARSAQSRTAHAMPMIATGMRTRGQGRPVAKRPVAEGPVAEGPVAHRAGGLADGGRCAGRRILAASHPSQPRDHQDLTCKLSHRGVSSSPASRVKIANIDARRGSHACSTVSTRSRIRCWHAGRLIAHSDLSGLSPGGKMRSVSRDSPPAPRSSLPPSIAGNVPRHGSAHPAATPELVWASMH
jgi:hypothetical protein